MKSKFQNYIKNNVVYMLMFVAIFIVHLNIEQTIDDIWFSKILDSYSIWGFISERYYTWASRSLIEAVLIVLTHCPIIIWQVLDSFVYVAIAWMLGKLIKENDYFVRIASCTFWMTYPFVHMNSAGYIATTLNYTWPLLGVLGAALFLKRQIEGKKLHWWGYILNFLCILYGANTEQGTAILIGAYVLIIGYHLLQKKKLPKMVYVQLVVLGAEMIYILTCPGNSARIAYETEHLFPEYAGLGLLRKAEMGVTSAMYHFLLIENVIFALFTFILWQVSRQYAKCDGERAIAATPFVLSLCFSICSSLFYKWFPQLEYIRTSLTEFGTLFMDKPESIFPCLIYGVAVVTILYCIYMLSREKWQHTLLLFMFIVLGFGSRMMLGFSASIWASSDRTYIFMYTGFILSSLYMLTLMKNQRVKSGVFYVSVLTGICSYISLLVSVL